MKENQINKETKVFDRGLPANFGYSLGGGFVYNIKDVHIPLFRLKEWNFYQFVNEKFSFYAILGHVSYATSIDFTLFEFETGKHYHVGKLLPFKRISLDDNANKDSVISYKDKNINMTFDHKGKTTNIMLNAKSKEFENVSANIVLEDTQDDSILVLTPFEHKKHFYLNQKKCIMKASGSIQFDDVKFNLDQENSFGLLDWGRGYLPLSHHWIWGSLSGVVDGKYFGFNIGKFGNNTSGSENIFFYDNKSYKMDVVEIIFDENDYTKPFEYRSNDGNFVFKMTPFYDNHTKTKVLWVDNECHQIFGRFNGYIIVEDKKIEIKDLIGFTENAYNRW